MNAIVARAYSFVSGFRFSVAQPVRRPSVEEPRIGEYRADYSSLTAEELAQESGCEELIRKSRVISVNRGL